jgi:hypothetical protein
LDLGLDPAMMFMSDRWPVLVEFLGCGIGGKAVGEAVQSSGESFEEAAQFTCDTTSNSSCGALDDMLELRGI